MGNNYCWFQVKLKRLPKQELEGVDSLSLPLAGPMTWPEQILWGQEKHTHVSCRGFCSQDFLALSANLLIKELMHLKYNDAGPYNSY